MSAVASHFRSSIGLLQFSSWLLIITCFFVSASAAPSGSANNASGNQYKPALKYPKVHGFLMWASMGFCMPVGILIVRMTKSAMKRGDSSRRIRILVYSHTGIQSIGVILSVAGGAVALANFGKEFRYTHERLGLSLFILAWTMPILGALRPNRGHPFRQFWYALHWLIGTATVILGFINIYIGLHVYELISSSSLRTWNILFSIQLSVMGLIYLAQDRWEYLQDQGQYTKPIAPQVAPGKNSAQPTSVLQV